MSEVRKINDTRGTVFDLPYALTLDDEDCNVLEVSTRTLFFIQRLGLGEVGFQTRYAEEFYENNTYLVADTESDKDEIAAIQNNYQLEVNDMSCNLVEAINALAALVANLSQAACGACGSELEATPLSPPALGPGTDFPTIADYMDYRCEASNWIMDGLDDIFLKLDTYDVDFWTNTTVALGTTLVASIIGTTILGLPILAVAGLVISIVGLLMISSGLSLSDIRDSLADERSGLICALFNSATAFEAKADFRAVLDTTSLSTAEKNLVGLILTVGVNNSLFEENPDVVGWTQTTPCASCLPTPCPLQLNKGTGTPTYDQQEFTIASEFAAPNQTINISVPISGSGCGNGNWCIEFTATTIDDPEGTYQRMLWCWQDAVSFNNSDFNGSFPDLDTVYRVGSMEFTSLSSFTVTMKIMARAAFCTGTPAAGCP